MTAVDPSPADDDLARLQAELDLHRQALDTLSVGVVVVGEDLRVLLANGAYTRAVGVVHDHVPQDVPQHDAVVVVHPDGTPAQPAEWPVVRSLREGVTVDGQVVGVQRPSGTTWIEISSRPLFRDGTTAPCAAIATVTDVTEGRASALALEESEAHFRLLAENSTDVITRHAADGTCLYASPALADLVGREPDDVIGRQATDFVLPQDHEVLRSAFLALLRSGEAGSVRYRMPHVEGRLVWVETVMRTVRLAGRVLELQSSTRDITRRVESEQRLSRLALGDALTGLANRAALQRHLEGLLADDAQLALLFLDLDRFKVVNDSLGHSAGDELLRTTAARLAGTCRDGDLVARLGGDEFVVVAAGLDEPGAVLLAARLQRTLSAPVTVGHHELVASASIGIVVSAPGSTRDVESLLRDADVSMYEAKAGGRARAVVWSAEAGSTAVERLTVEQELRQALETGQLVVHYQPQVELVGGRVVGVEALVRWAHPVRGLLPPQEFLGVADDTGMVVELGRQVLVAAAHQVASWRRLPGCADLQLSVNLSTQELLHPGRLEECLDVLADAGLPPDALVLEVLESVLLDPGGAVVAALEACVREGLQLALDDFGTGSSSLLHLRHAPVSTVKIDRTFVSGLGRSRQDEAIVRALLSLTTDLGLGCTAEGVEDDRQRAWLVAQGVTVAQGHLLHRPLAADALGELLCATAGTGTRG